MIGAILEFLVGYYLVGTLIKALFFFLALVAPALIPFVGIAVDGSIAFYVFRVIILIALYFIRQKIALGFLVNLIFTYMFS